MIILDTNVLSELMRAAPAPQVLTWVDRQAPHDLAITAITVAEILHGIARLPAGQRKRRLHALALTMFDEDFAERILPFDAPAATHYATLVAAAEARGRPVGMADAQIAAIAQWHEATVATRNLRDFKSLGVALFDPWIE